MEYKKFGALLCVLFTLICKWAVLCIDHEDAWIEPNAWSREERELSVNNFKSNTDSDDDIKRETAKRGEAALIDNGLALVYYKKFIAMLFNRKKLQYDKAVALYQRSVHFTILPAQLEQLEQLNDPRDLDTILTEIVANARSQHGADAGESMGILSLVLDIRKDLVQLLRYSEVQFAVLVLTVILLGWYIHRRYHIGIIKMIVVGVLLFGYFVTYLECNRKLEVEQMLEFIERTQAEKSLSEPSWYTPITRWFSPNEPTKKARNEQIKKSSRLNLAYCRPDHVLLLYANELFLSQLEFLLEKCVDTLQTLKENLSFPYYLLASFTLLVMIAYMIKLTFKYILSPKAWAALINRRSTHSQQHQQQHSMPIGAIHEDRISGDNLKLLLNAIVNPRRMVSNSDGSKSNSRSPISGVQEIVERLQDERQSSSSSANTSMEDQALEESDSTDNAERGRRKASIKNESKSCDKPTEALQSEENKPKISENSSEKS